jgi:hypothetical protein
VTVTLALVANGTAAAPFGIVETPLNQATNVTGSIGVTGWVLDDIEVTRVRILRDPVGSEPPGTLVYIGDAAFVDGARPDVAAAYPQLPRTTRAGWGYLLLTNFLPNLGNGTFRLHAYADDADGHTTLLGSKTITCTNATAVTPFGAIDTPGQGEQVSGVVHNFAWVLSPAPGRADVPGGGTVSVIIDGQVVGVPTGWTSRPDLTALFDATRYPGINTALAAYSFDSRTLANGTHTIAWLVTDNLGRAEGIGSRYFTVTNSSLVAETSAVAEDTMAAYTAEATDLRAEPAGALRARRGFDLTAPWSTYVPDAAGVITIEAEELDRLELRTGATAAHLLTPAGPAPLPIGARLDPADGTFTWLVGVGFVGAYDFAFASPDASRTVRIVLRPKHRPERGAQLAVDLPPPAPSLSPDQDSATRGVGRDPRGGQGLRRDHSVGKQ